MSHWGFIGCGPAPEICQYAFTVLLRQVKKARTLHIQNKLRYCKPAAKTKRADLFCRGWVESAGRAVTRFAGNDEQIKAIDAFMSKNYPNLGELQTRDRTDKKLKAYEYQDYLTGKEEGKQVELNHGVGAANKPLSIENCEAI